VPRVEAEGSDLEAQGGPDSVDDTIQAFVSDFSSVAQILPAPEGGVARMGSGPKEGGAASRHHRSELLLPDTVVAPGSPDTL
jgi:hypothetical protein